MCEPIVRDWTDFVPSLNQKKHCLILHKLSQLRNEGRVIFPPQNEIFNALNLLSPANVKVIILGQDPYHKQGQAHGLAFSACNNTPCPRSLKNIFKEIHSDIYNDNCPHKPLLPDLTYLAKQGVLLLNTILSVEESKPLSHANMGWQEITKDILISLANLKKPLVILLWGNAAKSYAHIFNEPCHLVLQAAHPSPLSASRGFFGCKHFSKSNDWLSKHNLTTIAW